MFERKTYRDRQGERDHPGLHYSLKGPEWLELGQAEARKFLWVSYVGMGFKDLGSTILARN